MGSPSARQLFFLEKESSFLTANHKKESSFLRANHTDSLLGPPFISESVQSGNSSVVTKMTRVDGVTGTYTVDTSS